MSDILNDYTKNSDINDKMISKSSPLENVVATDNIKFEGQNETDSFPRTLAGNYQTYGDFECIDPTTRVITMALGSTGLFFVNTNETGAGNITPGGLSKLFCGGDWLPNVDDTWDLGSNSFQWQNLYLVNAPTVSSDRKWKKDIKNIKYGLKQIERLRPVSFKRIDSPKQKRLGFIAQEVKEILPEVVKGNSKDGLGLANEEIIPVLVKAIQELSAKVKRLEEKML